MEAFLSRTSNNEARVKKETSKKHYNENNLLDRYIDKVLDLVENMYTVVRKNHVTKKAFKVTKLKQDLGVLEKDIYKSLAIYMYKIHKSHYNKGYQGWVMEEIPYEPDRVTKSIKEMQEEFLAKKQVTIVPTEEIDYLNKDKKIFKSKSYYNDVSDYKKALATMVHVYDGLNFMTKDGSIDVSFVFYKLVVESKGSNFQTIYKYTQTSNKNLKTRVRMINEMSIPKFIEEHQLVEYNHAVCEAYYKRYTEPVYKSNKKAIEVNGNRFVVDDTWED